MRKTIAKAVTWRLIGTAEIFAISFWTTGHIVTAGHTAAIAAITSFVMYVAHEMAWHDVRCGIKLNRMKAMLAQMFDHAWTGVRPISTPENSVDLSADAAEELPPQELTVSADASSAACSKLLGFVPWKPTRGARQTA